MIRQNQRFFNLALVVIDMIVIAFSLIFAWFVRFQSNLFIHEPNLGFGYYLLSLLIILPLYLLLYSIFGLYKPQRTKSIRSLPISILKANAMGLLMLVTFLFLIEQLDYSRYLLALFAISSTVFSIIERVLFRQLLRFIRRKGFNIKYVLMIGAGVLGEQVATKLNQREYLGYDIIGFLDDNIEKGHRIADSQVIGTINDLCDVILTNQVDKVIITISPRHLVLLESIIDLCERYGVKAEIVPDYYRYFPAKHYIDMIDDIPIIDIRYVPLDSSFKKVVKRISDLVFAIFGIIFLSPILILTAVIIKLSSPGPVIFKQERLGLNRKKFVMYKFRSMKIQDDKKEKHQWTVKDDPRTTKFGSFIRKTSIDELPQLFNILKGDMSLIGPRPERPFFVEKFREEVPEYMIKHHVRPGMSGWAQVHGWRGNTSIKKRIEFDIYYVENWTLILDIKIFFMTLIKGFVNKNAY
ncbi:undecaprenyl-phosphate glucose phosphotransferase [Methanobacterium sp.]|uniref:undecaprenyl-phosphate glucose phosphotransferase n=1 Tax=Methanobacterium sp. TaxID=2164 RepID=UPI003C749D34